MAEITAEQCKLCLSPAVPRYCFASFNVFECASCGFHFINYLDPAELELGGEVRDLTHNSERLMRNTVLLRSFVPDGRVLDIGCGSGEFLAALLHHTGVGVEPDRRYRALAGRKGLTVSPDWPTGTFDAVTLWDVIEHVNDPVEIIGRAYERLRPGGVLLLDTPNRDGALYRLGELGARIRPGMGRTLAVQYAPDPFCHKQIFRKRDMRRLLDRFSEVTIRERFELSFPTDYYMRHFIRWAPIRRILNPVAKTALRLLPVRNKLVVAAVK
jgi:2-polyprenyl-6-hydroxyphenyl methylase/3-demethylubiquinone-9 3-methyltransferase